MNHEAILKLLAALKSRLVPETCLCLVEQPDGTVVETSIDEWWEHRREWQWKKMTHGNDVASVLLVLISVNEEAAEAARARGDVAAYDRLTAESAEMMAEYQRRKGG